MRTPTWQRAALILGVIVSALTVAGGMVTGARTADAYVSARSAPVLRRGLDSLSAALRAERRAEIDSAMRRVDARLTVIEAFSRSTWCRQNRVPEDKCGTYPAPGIAP